MQISINKTKFRLYLGTLLFLLSGHLYLIVDQTMERIFLLASVPFFYKEYRTIFQLKKARWCENVHVLFMFCFFFDVILFFTATPIIYALGMFYIWVVAFRVFPYVGRKYGIDFYRWIYKVNFIVSLVAIGCSYLFEPIRLTNYSGLFVNPNTFGNYAAFATVFLIPLFLDYLKYKHTKNINLYISIIIFVILCISVIISSSRTSFLTVLFEIVLFIFYVMKISLDLKNKKLFKKIFYGIISIIIFAAIVLVFTDLPEILNNAIFNKFTHLSDNQLNGREEFWQYIWSNSRLFENGIKDVGAPHNVYFGLIDQFGKLAGIFYLLYVVLNFLKNFRLSMKRNSGFWIYCAVFAGVGFILVSMTESYLLTNSMLWFYIMIPIKDVIECQTVNKAYQIDYEDKFNGN